MIKQRIILLLLSVTLSLNTIANDSKSHYAKAYDVANTMYAEGMFKEAAEQYEIILNANFVSSDVYYNLGNSYFKSGNIALAILNYERARQLNPLDEDILFNLELANRRITDEVKEIPQLFYERGWIKLANVMFEDEWSWLACMFSFFIALSITWYILSRHENGKRLAFALTLVFMVLCGISIVLANKQKTKASLSGYAIIMNPSVTILSEPSLSGTELYVVHEGLKVKILEDTRGWFKISLSNGDIGWINESHAEGI